MKTVYTDTYGLRPIVWTVLGAYALVSSIVRGSGWQLIAGVALAFGFLLLAARDIYRRAKARREGRDHAIVRVVEND